MNADIVMVRECDGYRLLHGHLHLANQFAMRDEVMVEVRDEGAVRIMKTQNGYVAGKDGQRLPVRAN